MNARDYYALPDEERRRYGLPPVDHAEYTDLNARAIRAYVRLYEATGDDSALELAARAGGVLLAERQTEQGWFVHATDTAPMRTDDRMRGAYTGQKVFLRSQGQMGLALLALYGATADARWLNAAVKLADGCAKTLEDRKRGGFFASQADEMDAFAPRRKPIEPNAVMARFLVRLATYTKRDAYRESATRAVRAVALAEAVREEGRLIGNLALALDLLATGTLEFTVVGSRGDPAADALFAAARDEYDPRKVLHYEAPGRYPARDRAAMYICNEAACSRPIEDPARVTAEAARFRAQ